MDTTSAVPVPLPTEGIHLRSGGVSVVVSPDAEGQPVIAHWGADLGALSASELRALAFATSPAVSHSALDRPRRAGLVLDLNSGFTGTPSLEGARLEGPSIEPRLGDWTWTPTSGTSGILTGTDAEAGWRVGVHLALTPRGLLRIRTEVTNLGASLLSLAAVRTVVPVPAEAAELLDLTGRWCKERTPQRHPFVQGSFMRNARHGRTGHDASLMLVAGVPGFGFRHGEVWAVHTAWSGNHTTYAERTPEGESLLGGGELLAPGEITLAQYETYQSPWLLAGYSADGLDGLSAEFHAWLRSQAPARNRPVIVNTWEAVYFDHDLDRLVALADAAAAVGAERFVLDDGWFLGRRNDLAGLGDWIVDPQLWPQGLHPLIEAVHERGLEFGLWVEPEMVNLDSEVIRAHPDWVLRGRTALPGEWRHQQVLDLQHPGAYAHVRDQLMALLDEYDIAYLKWDHNRDLIDVTHEGRPAVAGQTRALYRLLDELRAAHPEVEIESCASGGGRVDAEILTRTDRIWPSDTIDAIERQHLQRWTGLLVPPEMMGSHLGGPVAHTTGRAHRLGLRAATGLLYHFGIEWDLTTLSPDELEAVGAWVSLHKRIRPIISTGTYVRGDHPDPAIVVTGVVSEDLSEGWYVMAAVAATGTQHPAPVRLQGLDPQATYTLTDETPGSGQHSASLSPTWADDPVGVALPGVVLARTGVRLPPTAPDTARVWRVTRG